jgi:hypothetical protein
MITIALILFGFLVGCGFGFVLFRSERAYRQGWLDGERHGRVEGYRDSSRKNGQVRRQPLKESGSKESQSSDPVS